jgi:hypothetical protein
MLKAGVPGDSAIISVFVGVSELALPVESGCSVRMNVGIGATLIDGLPMSELKVVELPRMIELAS